ncbi:MAG TPA: N-acetylmuramoyl-L-alanine amidase, partial [Chloroflexota bacterium]|nr:N-acetylmuramoyl-L-alanine amidase [Chloroflexota bacterium]
MLPISSVATFKRGLPSSVYSQESSIHCRVLAVDCGLKTVLFIVADQALYPGPMLAVWLSAFLLLASPVDVALDPGHSVADVGAAGGGFREYTLTLDLAQRARRRLEDAGLSVRLTREDNLPLTPLL